MTKTGTSRYEHNVFLVSGRNEAARKELIHFLGACGVGVISWEEAVSLTDTDAPTTLEIVATALATADAVIVLLTGDDSARLNPAFGQEGYRLQPRQNVIFEAGWALATAGPQKTILVALGEVSLLTDLRGLPFVQLSDEPGAREELATRLESAGLTLRRATGWLDRKKAGNFDKVLAAMQDDPELDPLPSVRTEDWTPYLVDSALSLKLDPFTLHEQIRDAVALNNPLNLKYHYIGTTMAKYWRDVCNYRDYGHDLLAAAARGAVQNMLKAAGLNGKRIDFVSLGPGDGRLDVDLLQAVQRDAQIGMYFPVDISHDLLRLTVKSMREAFENGRLRRFALKALHADFEENLKILDPVLNPYEGRARTQNVFALTGFTLGNSKEDTLVQSVRDAMEEGDVLIVDARLHDLGDVSSDTDLTDTHRKKLTTPYSGDAINRFAFGPVELACEYAVRAADVRFEHEVRAPGDSSVPSAINVYLSCSGLQDLEAFHQAMNSPRRMRRRGPDTLRLATVTFYDYDRLLTWFGTQRLEVVWSERHGTIGLFALRVTSTGPARGLAND